MTLVVSEVSNYGIAMAADSAITTSYPPGWVLASGTPAPPTIRTGAQKIIPIKTIDAAISVWGFGTVGIPNDLEAQIPIDKFLKDFANSVDDGQSLDDVGEQLAYLINERIRTEDTRGGFHLSGYIQAEGKKIPVLYHIHNGHRQKPPYDKVRLYRDYPFDIGYSVDKWFEDLQMNSFFYLRNGIIDTYARFHDYLTKLMVDLSNEFRFLCPDHAKFSTALEARGKFLRLQIETICDFYRLSNRLEVIAKPVSWITISPEGIQHFEPIVI